MDHIDLREIESIVDLESVWTTSKEVNIKDPSSLGTGEKKRLGRVRSGVMISDGSIHSGDGLSSIKDGLNSGGHLDILVSEVGEESTGSLEKKRVKKKWKKNCSEKPPKPPRPPGELSLDAADMKLVKEMYELVQLKRENAKRMKAIQKMRTDKTPSSSSNIFAMVITILFFCIIIFQGCNNFLLKQFYELESFASDPQ